MIVRGIGMLEIRFKMEGGLVLRIYGWVGLRCCVGRRERLGESCRDGVSGRAGGGWMGWLDGTVGSGRVDMAVVIPDCETSGRSGTEFHFSHIHRNVLGYFDCVLGGDGQLGG